MNDAQRLASMSNSRLSWTGPVVTSTAPFVLAGGATTLQQLAPSLFRYVIFEGGLAWTTSGITGDVVLANDAIGTVSDACTALIAGGPYIGRIVLVDRGGCTFDTKVDFAEAAGAIGVIIANHLATTPFPPGSVTASIFSGMISLADGNAIKALLSSGTVTMRMYRDTSALAGTDILSGRVLLYAPNPIVPGSSVSHFDTSAIPNQLMEPSINADLTHSVQSPQDLTSALMVDIGWALANGLEGSE